jgi:hypothetical protein
MDLTIKELIKIILLDKKKLWIIFFLALTAYPLVYVLKYYNKYEAVLKLDTRNYITNLITTENSFEKVLVNTFKYHISMNYTANKNSKDFKCVDSQNVLMICKTKSLDKGIAENKIQDLINSINKLYELSIEETSKVMTDIVFQKESEKNKNSYSGEFNHNVSRLIKTKLEKEKKEKFFLILSSELKKNQFSWNTYGISIIAIFLFYILFVIISKENYKKNNKI